MIRAFFTFLCFLVAACPHLTFGDDQAILKELKQLRKEIESLRTALPPKLSSDRTKAVVERYHVLGPADIPTSGEGHDKISGEACRELSVSAKDCYYISNLYPGVPMYAYVEPYGVIYNNHLIASYLTLLLRDAYKHDNLGGSRDFVHKILNYLERSRTSPHEDMDVWLVNSHRPNGKLSDAMVQSQIALIYYQLTKFESTHPKKELWIARRDRAGRAFEWSWDKSGVAHVLKDNRYWYIGVGPNELEPRFALNVHNKAIGDMDAIYDALLEDNDPKMDEWKLRIVRGIHALIDEDSKLSVDKHDRTINGVPGSWHRVTKDGVGIKAADAGYHSLNWRTTRRVANLVEKYGFPKAAKDRLMLYVNKWKPPVP